MAYPHTVFPVSGHEGARKIVKIDIDANFDNTEQSTGFTLPAKCVVHYAFLDVTTADAGETLDVGTDGSGSNDPNGFLAAVSVNATGIVTPSLASGGQTLGALLYADEGTGELVPEPDGTSGGEAVTFTGSNATNTMRGSIYIEYTDVSAIK